jgi:hypothetical protein
VLGVAPLRGVESMLPRRSNDAIPDGLLFSAVTPRRIIIDIFTALQENFNNCAHVLVSFCHQTHPILVTLIYRTVFYVEAGATINNLSTIP